MTREKGTLVPAFYLDSSYLIDGEGNYCWGIRTVNVGSEDFSVNENGRSPAGGQLIDRIRLVSFQDNTALRKRATCILQMLSLWSRGRFYNYARRAGELKC